MSTDPSQRSTPARLDEVVALGAAGPLPVRVYGRRARASAPLVLHFHAGSFVAGNLDSGGRVAGLLAEAGAAVVSVDYPLAPAHPFPAAVEAGYAALEWALRERHRLAGPAARLWVAGEEAGGNLAAAVALMARDRQSPPLAGQILLSPMLDTCMATASLRKAHAGPVGCRWADGWHEYLSRPDDAIHPYAAPGRALRLAGLPATLLVTAQDDPMRDEARAYAERLREAGVTVSHAVMPGTTGWPCSYMEPAAERPPWADELAASLRRFLSPSAKGGTRSLPIQLQINKELP